MVDTPNWDSLSSTPPSTPAPTVQPAQKQTPNWEDLQTHEERYGTASEIAKTALEQAISGATLGASKVAETHLFGVNPADIAGREETNPGTSMAANILGTAGMIYGTGGTGALAEGASAAAKIGMAGVEGATIGGANQITDDWSQNKPLDAQKIAASSGLGALLGLGGASIVEGIGGSYQYVKGKFFPSAVTDAIKPLPTTGEAPLLRDTEISPELQNSIVADGPLPETKGIAPTTYQDIMDKVAQSKADGHAVALPQQAVLEDALSRVGMENPINPLQMDSLGSQQARSVYNTAKLIPGKIGQALNGLEAIQKNELVEKTLNAIENISPGIEPTENAIQGGKNAIDAFTDQYENENKALKPVFESLKNVPIQGDILPDAIQQMADAVPGVANMLDITGAELTIKPYRTLMGIDKSTYTAVAQAIKSLKDAPNDLGSLWKIRGGLDQNVDVMTQGKGPGEIRALKAALMDQMQTASGNPEIRDAFKRYAINQQQRSVIEHEFGASVGTPEFGAISKVVPEKILDKIFSNTATVNAAKSILPKKQFNKMLADWMAKTQASTVDNGAMSANKFGTFLKKNQSILEAAFADNPVLLQRLKDLTTIMRIIPDAQSGNPSGTASTLAHMLDLKVHNMTWEGMLAAIPVKIINSLKNQLQLRELNQALQGKATANEVSQVLQRRVERTSSRIGSGIESIFKSSASQTRKTNK